MGSRKKWAGVDAIVGLADSVLLDDVQNTELTPLRILLTTQNSMDNPHNEATEPKSSRSIYLPWSSGRSNGSNSRGGENEFLRTGELAFDRSLVFLLPLLSCTYLPL